jgi:hypothetical protein
MIYTALYKPSHKIINAYIPKSFLLGGNIYIALKSVCDNIKYTLFLHDIANFWLEKYRPQFIKSFRINMDFILI